MIKTIIFDLAEVYMKGFYGVEDYLENIIGSNKEDIRKGLQGPEFKPFMEGKISENDFWNGIIKRNGWKADVKHFKKAIRKNFEEIEGTRQIIEKLKKQKFKLVLLSDHSREWIEYCSKKFDYQKLFHSRQYSYDVECCKTDSKSFESLLSKIKEKPEDCLFIDDSRENIKVAKKVGINVILFESPEKLKKKLNFFGINIAKL